MLVLAHRGASGHAPENSLEAIRLARTLGADGVELDVHATTDGGLVVHHDFHLPGMGRIENLTTASARRHSLPNGEQLPTLGEALEAAAGLVVWIEVKGLPASVDTRLFETVDGSPSPDLCRVHGFDHRIIRRLGERRPSLPRGLLTTAYLLDPLSALRAAGAATLWQEWPLIDRHLVDTLHGAGANLIAWTVNETADARRLAELGVDGLCGNYPERLRGG